MGNPAGSRDFRAGDTISQASPSAGGGVLVEAPWAIMHMVHGKWRTELMMGATQQKIRASCLHHHPVLIDQGTVQSLSKNSV